MQPVYNLFYVKNKLLDFIWKMNAVTIAAQVLTMPISIYHFHQFPNLFLLTNFIAVPLSSLVVLGEILLCAVSFIPPAAFITGKILYGLIWFMNTWIERIEILPIFIMGWFIHQHYSNHSNDYRYLCGLLLAHGKKEKSLVNGYDRFYWHLSLSVRYLLLKRRTRKKLLFIMCLNIALLISSMEGITGLSVIPYWKTMILPGIFI